MKRTLIDYRYTIFNITKFFDAQVSTYVYP